MVSPTSSPRAEAATPAVSPIVSLNPPTCRGVGFLTAEQGGLRAFPVHEGPGPSRPWGFNRVVGFGPRDSAVSERALFGAWRGDVAADLLRRRHPPPHIACAILTGRC